MRKSATSLSLSAMLSQQRWGRTAERQRLDARRPIKDGAPAKAAIIDCPTAVVRADVQAVADGLKAAYLQAFDDTVVIALRWASTNERHRLEENFPNIRATNILERICAEGQLARLERDVEPCAPEAHIRQLALVARTIANCEEFEDRYPVLSRTARSPR